MIFTKIVSFSHLNLTNRHEQFPHELLLSLGFWTMSIWDHVLQRKGCPRKKNSEIKCMNDINLLSGFLFGTIQRDVEGVDLQLKLILLNMFPLKSWNSQYKDKIHVSYKIKVTSRKYCTIYSLTKFLVKISIKKIFLNKFVTWYDKFARNSVNNPKIFLDTF